jgi:hypothetical protein
MAFEKGKSGNPAGKPKGTISKHTRILRELLETEALVAEMSKLGEYIAAIEDPYRKAELLTKVAAYFIPKAQDVDGLAEAIADKITTINVRKAGGN